MSKKRAVFVLITLAALGGAVFALSKILSDDGAAAVGAAVESHPRIEKFEVSREKLPSDESTDVTVSVRGARASRYELSATCPRGVSLALDGKDICGRSTELAASALTRETLAAAVSETATGTVAISLKISEPEVPVAPWTQRTVLLRID